MIIKTESKNYQASIVIDSLVNNTSSGGVRIIEGLEIDEVKKLAGEMSLKYSFIGIKKGGAKCGINLSHCITGKEKIRILEDFGRDIAPIISQGIFYPGMDMNCGDADIKAIYRGAGFNIKKVTDTSFFTAISVDQSVRAMAGILNSNSSKSIAIEGFGKVGEYLSLRLPNEFKITGISTVEGAVINENGFSRIDLLNYKKKYGDGMVDKIPGIKLSDKSELFKMKTDIFIPSSRTGVINRQNVDDLNCSSIVPIANAPYEEETLRKLYERGIIFLPGFVTNCGGVFASSLFDCGLTIEEIEEITSEFYHRVVLSLIRKSREINQPTTVIAEGIAQNRLKENIKAGRENRVKKYLRKNLTPRYISATMKKNEFIGSLIDLNEKILNHKGC